MTSPPEKENARHLASDEQREHAMTGAAAQVCATVQDANALPEIRALHAEIISAARTSLERAVRIGELLSGIRQSLKHGEWLPWCAAHLPFSDKTARNYLRVYSERDRLKLESVSNLTGAYQMLAGPDRTVDPRRDWPDAKALAEDISDSGRIAFEAVRAETESQLEDIYQRLQNTQNIRDVMDCITDTVRLQSYWAEVRLHAERAFGRALIEMKALIKPSLPELSEAELDEVVLAIANDPDKLLRMIGGAR